jgi:hypothetical protein
MDEEFTGDVPDGVCVAGLEAYQVVGERQSLVREGLPHSLQSFGNLG